MAKAHPLKGPNRLKLGVFSANADGGLAITDVSTWTATTTLHCPARYSKMR